VNDIIRMIPYNLCFNF